MIRTYGRQLRKFSPEARRYLTALLFQFMGQALVMVLRNLYLKKAGFDEEFIGITLAIASGGATLAITALAGLMDRRRLKGFMIAGSLMMSAGLYGVAQWPEPLPVLGFSLMTGLGVGTSQMCMPLFFVRHSGPEERPYLFGVGQALMPLGALVTTFGIKLGALGLGESVEAIRIMMFAGAVAPLIAIVAIVRIRELPPEPPDPTGVEPPLDWRLGVKFWTTELLIGLGAGLTIPFINLYFHNRFQVEPGNIGLFYAAAESLMFFAFLATPVFASRWGAVRTILLFQLASIPFFLVMAFTTSLAWAVFGFLARQMMMNMVHPVSEHFLMEKAHPRQRARINGIKQMCRRGAWIVAPVASGILIERAPFVVDGFTTTMLATIALYLAGTALYWIFFGTDLRGTSGPAANLREP